MDSHNVFIKPKKVEKLIDSNSLLIYDTRTKIEYDELHFKKSILIKPHELIETIQKQGRWDKAIIVSRGLRTNLPIIRELRKLGYERVWLIDRNIKDWENKKYLKK